VEAALRETAGAWEQDGGAGGAGRERLGAVAATCLARMRGVCMDLSTGYLRLEAGAADRTSAPGKAVVEARLQALETEVRSLVSARATALLQARGQRRGVPASAGRLALQACSGHARCAHHCPACATSATGAAESRSGAPHAPGAGGAPAGRPRGPA
jgi:hypothetical protein